MKSSNTTHSNYAYEALAIFRSYGFSNYTYSGLKDFLLEKMNRPRNKQKIPELAKKDGVYDYEEICKILTRLARLEAIVEDYGATSVNAIDGISAARFLGVSKRTVDDLAAKNKVDSYHIGSRRLYRLSDLAKYRQSLVENNR
jgi:excisionase family DNA binding protein